MTRLRRHASTTFPIAVLACVVGLGLQTAPSILGAM